MPLLGFRFPVVGTYNRLNLERKRLKPKCLEGLGFAIQDLGFRLRDPRIWDFPKIRVPYFGVLIIKILLFRVLY